MNYALMSIIGLLAVVLFASVRINVALWREREQEPRLSHLAGSLMSRLRGLRPSDFDEDESLWRLRETLQECVRHFDSAAGRIPIPNEPQKLSATKLAHLHNTSAAEIQQRLIGMGYIISRGGRHYFTNLGLRVGGEYRQNHPGDDGHMVWPVDLPFAAPA